MYLVFIFSVNKVVNKKNFEIDFAISYQSESFYFSSLITVSVKYVSIKKRVAPPQ